MGKKEDIIRELCFILDNAEYINILASKMDQAFELIQIMDTRFESKPEFLTALLLYSSSESLSPIYEILDFLDEVIEEEEEEEEEET